MPYLTFSDLLLSQQQQQFDFIVLGAGSAGCPLASRLSEDSNTSVLLVEAGPVSHSIVDTLNVSLPAGAGKLQHASPQLDYAYVTTRQEPHACRKLHTFADRRVAAPCTSFWPRGKGLGGSSLINYMAWVRGFPSNYNAWNVATKSTDWTWSSQILPLFCHRIEDTTECWDTTTFCRNCHCHDSGTNTTNTHNNGVYGISQKSPPCTLATQFLQACQTAGYTRGDYNCTCRKTKTSTTRGVVGLHQQSVRHGTRCTAARAYIHPLMTNNDKNARPNLFVLTGAKCCKIILEKDAVSSQTRATGVQLVPDHDTTTTSSTSTTTASPTMTIHCHKEIIVSAGALGSPQLLLQSGIGPDLNVNLPHVGHNLTDHMAVVVRFPSLGGRDIDTVNSYKAEHWKFLWRNLRDVVFYGTGILTSSAYDASLFYHDDGLTNNDTDTDASKQDDEEEVSPNLQLSCMCSTTDQQVMQYNIGMDLNDFVLPHDAFDTNAQGIVLVGTLLNPKSRGFVKLAAQAQGHENHGVVIEPHYLTDPDNHDVTQLIRVLRKALEIATTPPLSNLIAKDPHWPQDLLLQYADALHNKLPQDYPDAFLEAYIRRYAMTLYHPTSTCRMGTSPHDGVVNSRLQVFGVDNLRIADASIQPTIVAANTQASCVVIGERAADFIRQDHHLNSNPAQLQQAVWEYEAQRQARHKKWFVVGSIVVLGGAATLAVVTVRAAILAASSIVLSSSSSSSSSSPKRS